MAWDFAMHGEFDRLFRVADLVRLRSMEAQVFWLQKIITALGEEKQHTTCITFLAFNHILVPVMF
jgi:hypothetical protein